MAKSNRFTHVKDNTLVPDLLPANTPCNATSPPLGGTHMQPEQSLLLHGGWVPREAATDEAEHLLHGEG